MPRSRLALALVGAGLIFAGCNHHDNQTAEAPATPPTPTAAAAAKTVAAAPAAPVGPTGTIKGVVLLTGKAPVMAELRRGTDPFCGKTKMKDHSVVANPNHTLKNVLVHVDGLPATAPPSEKVSVTQENCMYQPRVVGLVAGQTLDIRNADPTLHNVHTYRGASTVFNQAQVPGTPDIEKTFTDNGALLKLKCDVHQWMTGYVWVQNNPAFAVTGTDGSFEIKNVPAGTWTIEAWQERLGTKKAQVTVKPNQTVEVKFDYKGTETASK